MLGAAIESTNDKRKESKHAHIGNLYDVSDEKKLRILLERVALEAARRYEYILLYKISDDTAESIIPFAKVGVERMLEYIARNKLDFTENNLLLGLIEGRSGAYVSGYTNTHLSIKIKEEKERKQEEKTVLTAEGIYGRSAFKSYDNRYWVLEKEEAKHKHQLRQKTSMELNLPQTIQPSSSNTSKLTEFKSAVANKFSSTLEQAKRYHNSFYNYGYTKFSKQPPYLPKYGYANVPLSLIQYYGYHEYNLPLSEKQHLRQSSSQFKIIDRKDVVEYLKAINNKSSQDLPSFNEFIARQYSGIKIAICPIDFRGLDLSFADFSGSDLSHANLEGCSLKEAKFVNTIFFEANLNQVNAENAIFKNAHLEFASAENTNFTNVDLTQAALNYANLTNAILADVKTQGTLWVGTNLTNAKLQSAIFEKFIETQQLQEQQLQQNYERLSQLQKEFSQQHTALHQLTQMLAKISALTSLENQGEHSKLAELIAQFAETQNKQDVFERYCRYELYELKQQSELAQVRSDLVDAQILKLESQIKQLTSLNVTTINLVHQIESLTSLVGYHQIRQEKFNIQFENISNQAKSHLEECTFHLRVLKDDIAQLKQEIRAEIKELSMRQQQLEGQQAEIKQVLAQQQVDLDSFKERLEQLEAKSAQKIQPADVLIKGLYLDLLGDEFIFEEQALYVPVVASWSKNHEKPFDLDKEVSQFMGSNKKVLLLLGDSGSGKTMYCQNLAIRLGKERLDDYHSATKSIPLYISLPSLNNPVEQAIEESLKKYGLTDEQIIEMKKNRQFIFILDGYDEINQNKNLYVTNRLHEWNAKVVISCRSSYRLITTDAYENLFMPFNKGTRQAALFTQAHVVPFNRQQIGSYIDNYLSVNHQRLEEEVSDTKWLEKATYEQYLQQISGVNKLIENPFLLKITMDVLPTIAAAYEEEADAETHFVMTGIKLYAAFIHEWYVRQENKLIGRGEEIPPGLEDHYMNFCEELASEMFKHNTTQIIYRDETFAETSQSTPPNPWSKFFSDKSESHIALARKCAPLRKVGKNTYAFLHTSLQEYFVSLAMAKTNNMSSQVLFFKPGEPEQRNKQAEFEDKKLFSAKTFNNN